MYNNSTEKTPAEYVAELYPGNQRLAKWYQSLDCLWFSESVIAGDPYIIELAKSKFLRIGCGITVYDGKILIADINGEGKMREVFTQMLEMATPERHALKGDDFEEFFAPFASHIITTVEAKKERLLHKLKNNPKETAIEILAAEQYKHLSIYGKQGASFREKKFDFLYQEHLKKQ